MLRYIALRHVYIRVFRDCDMRKNGAPVYKQSPVTFKEAIMTGSFRGPVGKWQYLFIYVCLIINFMSYHQLYVLSILFYYFFIPRNDSKLFQRELGPLKLSSCSQNIIVRWGYSMPHHHHHHHHITTITITITTHYYYN